MVGDETDEDGDREGESAEEDGVPPLRAAESGDVEGFAADEDDHDLAADHDDVYGDEKPISVDTFEDVEFVVQAAIAVREVSAVFRT